ncbi:MAG: hypothetical protein VW405_02220, partial [Rhodospirillaceae bacterium]
MAVLIVFAVAIMEGVTARLIAEPGFVLLVTAVSFAVYTGLFVAMAAILAIIRRQWGRRLGLSFGLAAGARNLGVILAVLPAGADPDMVLYFAVG